MPFFFLIFAQGFPFKIYTRLEGPSVVGSKSDPVHWSRMENGHEVVGQGRIVSRLTSMSEQCEPGLSVQIQINKKVSGLGSDELQSPCMKNSYKGTENIKANDATQPFILYLKWFFFLSIILYSKEVFHI